MYTIENVTIYINCEVNLIGISYKINKGQIFGITHVICSLNQDKQQIFGITHVICSLNQDKGQIFGIARVICSLTRDKNKFYEKQNSMLYLPKNNKMYFAVFFLFAIN